MELPMNLKAAVEKRVAGADVRRMAEIAEGLTERYRAQSGRGKVLVSRADEAVVYAAVRMPATYGAARAALGHSLAASGLRPRTLLDAGAGTGTASWAAAELLALDEVTCLEREAEMLELGRAFMREVNGALGHARWMRRDIAADAIPEKADLVVASYMLNELSGEGRARAVERLWDATGQMLLVVEPGTPECHCQLIEMRERLLKIGAHVAAPCPHEDICPMTEGDWCHFACRIARGRLHKRLKDAEVPYEDEKFAYMAFVREAPPKRAARVLRHPMTEKGRITLDVCAAVGIERRDVRKRDGEKYKIARKLKWGDAVE